MAYKSDQSRELASLQTFKEFLNATNIFLSFNYILILQDFRNYVKWLFFQIVDNPSTSPTDTLYSYLTGFQKCGIIKMLCISQHADY